MILLIQRLIQALINIHTRPRNKDVYVIQTTDISIETVFTTISEAEIFAKENELTNYEIERVTMEITYA